MEERLDEYMKYLELEERSKNTCRQYQRDIRRFLEFTGEQELTKKLVLQYKEKLQSAYEPASVNAKLAALNGFFHYLGREELRVKPLRIQKRAFCPKEKELTRQDYDQLLKAAARKSEKLFLMVQTICGIGIRVSELKAITAEAVNAGEAIIQNKGKIRVVLIPETLRQHLKTYMNDLGITAGPVFITRRGNPLDRSNIWKMLKNLSAGAQVEAKKVFPHNLRHLFARCFYSENRDIAKLADILGHSNINTTRIYILSDGWEHREQMEKLGLIQ